MSEAPESTLTAAADAMTVIERNGVESGLTVAQDTNLTRLLNI